MEAEKSKKIDDGSAMLVEGTPNSSSAGCDPDRGGTKDSKANPSSLTCVSDCGVVGEQFLQLAKSAKGAAAVQLIKEALEAPGLYVFAELLHMPNIKEVCIKS